MSFEKLGGGRSNEVPTDEELMNENDEYSGEGDNLPEDTDDAAEIEMNAGEVGNELKSPEEILYDVHDYAIRDGKVYSKESKEEITNEDEVLRIKTSKFLYRKAKEQRDLEKHMLGDRFNDRGPEYCTDKMMERWGFYDENAPYRQAKMMKALVNGEAIHTHVGENTLEGSEYGMLIGDDADMGRALLDYRLRQKGKELVDYDVKLDTTDFRHEGTSALDIEVETKPVGDDAEMVDGGVGNSDAAEAAGDRLDGDDGVDTLHHPQAEWLNRLTRELRSAEEAGDETRINGARAAMKMVVENNRWVIAPEEWENMDKAGRVKYMRTKMMEAKALGDKDEYNYWKANTERVEGEE